MTQHNSQYRDRLVEGPLLPAIWHMAYPMVVTLGLHSLFNLVDIYFVGKLGPDAVAAVGMSGIVMFVVMIFTIGLAVATRALVARFIGAEDYDKAVEVASATLTVAMLISAFAGVFGTLLAPQILELLGAEDSVLMLGVQYIRIMFIGMMGMAFTGAVNSILQGAGDAKTPMYILLFSNGLNMLLDPMLIMGYGPFPKLGVTGAAIATVSTQGMAMIIGLIVLLKGVKSFRVPIKKIRWNSGRIWQILKIGIPAAVQPALGNIINLAMVRIVSGFGTEAIAALVLTMRIHMFVMLPGFGLGTASGTIVGQNLGAGIPKRAKRTTWITCGILEVIFIVVGIPLYIFAPWLIAQFNDHPEVVRIGSSCLRLLILGYPLFAFVTVLQRAVNGAGITHVPAIVLAIALFGVQVPLAILLSRTSFEVRGIFLAMIAAFALQAIIFIWYFLTERWTRQEFR